MKSPSGDLRVAYFDSIAEDWDGWHDRDLEQQQLTAGLVEFGLGRDETVLDVGCGTGNLTRALLAQLDSAGRVLAVDPSAGMLDVARAKIDDGRVRWLQAPVEALPLSDDSVDRVICYSMWPHVADAAVAARELRRVLRPGGKLHVWHLASRARINEIHANAGAAVRSDLLPPAAVVARILERAGFVVVTTVDDDDRFVVSARWESTS